MKKILSYLINGLLIVVPVGITILIIAKVVSWIDQIFKHLGVIVNAYVDPWLVIIAALLLIIFLGALGTTLFFKPLFSLLDQALEKTPVIKTVYSSIKDIFSAFVGSKKKFNKPVLVAISADKTIKQIGFMTSENLEHLHISGTNVAVYLPTSYSFAGKVLIVPADHVTPINAPAGEVMKFVLSGGIAEVDKL